MLNDTGLIRRRVADKDMCVDSAVEVLVDWSLDFSCVQKTF
jgi:hypothetical protein